MPPTNRLLIQVLAQLKPERCGVSDHALRLAQELKGAFAIDTAFVVLNSTEPCNSPFPRVYCDPSQLLEASISLYKGRRGALLVHYSGYGYARDGAPLILAEALERVVESEQFRVGTYFHELYATGMPWRSAFWYTRRQMQVVRRLAQASDLIATNSNRHLEWLEREAIPDGVPAARLLPMFSNVGECTEPPRLATRQPKLAIFGLADTRRKAFRRLSSLGDLLHTLGISEILDVGPEFDAPSELNGVPIRRMGVLAAPELAAILSQTMFGFVQHASICLAKSGVFAGFCALGTIPLVAEHFPDEVDGLKDGVHLISPRTAAAAVAGGLEKCSTAAWQWYSGHRLHVHAGAYAGWVDGLVTEAGSDLLSASRAAGA